MKKPLPIIIFSLILFSCVKDKPQDNIQPQVQLTSSKKVYIVNEGIFNSGNASVTLYDTGNDAVVENFYQTQNNSNVGDVAQSLSKINGKFYLVVNNSGKIIVLDEQFKKTTQITNLSSPRYILPVTNQKAYVSDYSGNAISIVDLNTNTKISTIPCPGFTEEMVLIYNKAFVTNVKRNYVYTINTINDTKTDSINVGPGAGSIVIDKNDKIWVLGSGDGQNNVAAKLSKIDPVTSQVEVAYTFGANDSPFHLCLNKTKDTLYFIKGGIYRMAITDAGLPPNAFIAKGTKNFYGIGINPNNHTIYTSDALDYISNSNIYVYDAAGNEKKHFKAGLIANGFYFE